MTVRLREGGHPHKFLPRDLRSPLFFPAVDFYYTKPNFPLDKHPRGSARSLNLSGTSVKVYALRRIVKMYALQTFFETMWSLISWVGRVATLAGRLFRSGKISELRRTVTLILAKVRESYNQQ